MKAVGFTDVEIKPVYFDKETVDSALKDMKDMVELKTISRNDVYHAVYSAKITESWWQFNKLFVTRPH